MKKFTKLVGVVLALVFAGIAVAGSTVTIFNGSSSSTYQSGPDCTTTAITSFYTVHVLDDNGSETHSYNTSSTSYFSVGSGC